MDPNQGIVCNLTGQIATFQKDCPDYKFDETYTEINFVDDGPVKAVEIKHQLSAIAFEKLQQEQNLSRGLFAGIAAGLLGAILWCVVSVATGYQIGYMAVAIGAGVGFAIRKLGNGVDKIFGYWGAIISFLSVILGNVLSIYGFAAESQGIGYVDALMRIHLSVVSSALVENFSIIDLLFYGIAIYEGYRFSFRVLTQEDIQELNKNKF